MKTFATLLLSLCALAAAAQTKVISSKNAAREGLDVVKLVNSYSSQDNSDSKPFFEVLSKAISSGFPENPRGGIAIMTQFFVNASGQVDYLIFDVRADERYDVDSLQAHTKSLLSKHFTGLKTVNASGKPFQINLFNNIGKIPVKREVRKIDSSAVDLKSAVAVTDTLKIKHLFLHQLELKSVPDVIYRFPNLETLYLGDNELSSVRIDMKRLPRLQQLHLQGNKLTNAEFQLTTNKSIQLLNLKANKFTDIPAAVKKCKNMTTLWLGGNALSGLSGRSFGKMKQVKDLNFYKSDIAVLPNGIRKMRGLEVLDLYYNKLESLPKSIVKLKKLTHLAISNNQLESLPEKIDKLKMLNTLYAHHNHLSKLPQRIVGLQNLKILDLGYNWFTNFPAELTAFATLQELDLSSNNFPEFPEQLLKIKRLDKLYIRGNPFIHQDSETKYSEQFGLLKSKNIEVFY